MNTQEHDISIVEVQTAELMSDHSEGKRPWSRPVVTFVPMQVTADAKTGGGSDGAARGFTP